jgi:hypothetical protein
MTFIYDYAWVRRKKMSFFASKKMDVSNSRQERCRNEELFIVYRSVDNIYEKEQNDKVMSFIDLWLYPQIYNENFSCLLSYFNIYISMTHHINMYVGWIHKYPFSLGRHGSLQLFNFYSCSPEYLRFLFFFYILIRTI